MELLLSLWKESFKRAAPPAGAGILAAVLLFLCFRCWSLTDTFSPMTVDGLDPGGMEGAWVEDEVTHIYAAYAREAFYRGGELVRVNSVQYVIPCGEDSYMGMLVRGGRLEESEALLAACDRAYLGVTGENVPAFRVRGTVRAMDAKTLSLYHDAAGGDREAEQSMLPYYIDVGRLDGHAPAVLWAVLLLSAALFIAGLSAIVWAVAWGGQRGFLAKAAEYGELAGMVDKLEKLSGSVEPVGSVWLDREFVMFQCGAVSVLCRPWDIAWVYWRPFRSWRRVSVCMMDGKRYALWMREAEAEKLVTAMGAVLPGASFGWNRDIAREYRRDRAGFLYRWEVVRAEARKR